MIYLKNLLFIFGLCYPLSNFSFSSWVNSYEFVKEVEQDIRWLKLSEQQQAILKNIIDDKHDLALDSFQKNIDDYQAVAKQFDILYLVCAQIGCQNQLIEYLFNQKVRVSHYVVGLSCKQTDAELCRVLLKHKVNPNFILKNSDTWLMTAIKNNNYKVVWCLLKYDANRNLKNNNNQNSFDFCILYYDNCYFTMQYPNNLYESMSYISQCLIRGQSFDQDTFKIKYSTIVIPSDNWLYQ